MDPEPKETSNWPGYQDAPTPGFAVSPTTHVFKYPEYDYKLPRSPPTHGLTEADFKRRHHFYAFAMDHYNKSIDNEEGEYKISCLVPMRKLPDRCFGSLGFLHHLFWEAVPKNSSSTAEPKILYARVHDMVKDIHIPFCGVYSDSVDVSESCEICGLKNLDEFEKKDKELMDKAAERAKRGKNSLYPWMNLSMETNKR